MYTIRFYIREFRESAVGLVLSQGLSIRVAAEDLGMPYHTLHSWVRGPAACAANDDGRRTGAPWQNGIVESFNSRLRDELLSSEIFTTLAEAQLLCARWCANYNHRRPQRSLGKQTAAEYAAQCEVSVAQRMVQRMETTGNTRNAASIMIAETS